MDMKMLRYAIEDAERFVKRAKDVLNEVDVSIFEESDQRSIRRLSLDVTHAMKDLRDSIDMGSETTRTTA